MSQITSFEPLPYSGTDDRVNYAMSPPPIRPAAHLLVLPVPFLQRHGRLHLELQASDGLRRWVSNFCSMIVAAPTADEAFLARNPGIVWVPGEELADAVQYVPLPMAFKLGDFIRHYRRTQALLADCIDKARYLQFAIGALIGDWAGVAAEIAIQKGRKYAVHMDRVEDQLILKTNRNQPLYRRVKARLTSPMMRRWHHRLIARSNLSLFNGQDCLDAYGRLTPASYRIYDVHVDADSEAVHKLSILKQEEVQQGAPLNICYTGRLDIEKAPCDWVRAIAHAHSRGVKLKATWLGDGPLRAKAVSLAEQLGLSELISFPGFVRERQQVLELIASSHAMVFTHISPESPRCLVEALMHATPILGYGSAYSRDLVKLNGGGLHATLGDFEGLGELLVKVDRDRSFLAELIYLALKDGRQFSGSKVFRVRSELIVKHLG
jgi:glycosyltransferase involved in cell wall biosynthesis